MGNKLTEWEWRGLESAWNLADGHARQSPTEAEMPIWNSLGKMAYEVSQLSQKSVENEFFDHFFKLNKIDDVTKYFQRPLLHYSSSVTIEIIANLARKLHWSIDLVTPTFDNIADIFKRHNLTVTPVNEDTLFERSLFSEGGQALFLTLPNNPTGFEIDHNELGALIYNAAQLDKVIIIDASFRLLGSESYEFLPKLLHDLNVDFVVIEDTGKYFATLGLKCGFCWSSDGLWPSLNEITNDVLLSVSPLNLKLISMLSRNHLDHGSNVYESLLTQNYARVDASLKKFGIKNATQANVFSVLWAELPEKVNAVALCDRLASFGLVLLPGGSFYWHDPDKGSRFIRFALMRNKEYITQAMDIFDLNFDETIKQVIQL